jgi:hypothetical protein
MYDTLIYFYTYGYQLRERPDHIVEYFQTCQSQYVPFIQIVHTVFRSGVIKGMLRM